MATYYLVPTLHSKYDVPGWRDAYTSPSALDAVLQDGDTVYGDASEDDPWRTAIEFNNHSGLRTIWNEGPSSQTCITDGRFSTGWTGASAPYQLTLAAKPKYVVNNYRRDDLAGTKTGWAYNEKELDLLHRLGVPLEWAKAPLGFMLEDTSTPTTPASGKWGYSGGVLYVNPDGSPTLPDIIANVQYCPGSFTGILYSNCDYLNHSGKVNGWLLPDSVSQAGYVVRGNGCTESTIADVWACDSGWHAAGFAGNAGGINNRIRRCRAIGGTGDSGASLLGVPSGEVNPFVFYQPAGEAAYGGHIGRNLFHIMTPIFLDSGAPWSTNFAPRPCLSHSDSGTDFNDAVDWSLVFAIDMVDRLRVKHSVSFTKFATPCSHNNGAITDAGDRTTYPVQLRDSYFTGRMRLQFNGQTGYSNVFLDGEGCGQTSENGMSGSGQTLRIAFDDGYMIPGNHTEEFIDNLDTGDMLAMQRNKIYLVNAVNRSGFIGQAGDTAATYSMRLGDNTIESNGVNTHCFVRASNATIYNNNLRSTLSLGGNVIGTAMEGTGGHSNPGVAPWDTDDTVTLWAARITGAATDSRAATGLTPASMRAEFWENLFPSSGGSSAASSSEAAATPAAYSPTNSQLALSR